MLLLRDRNKAETVKNLYQLTPNVVAVQVGPHMSTEGCSKKSCNSGVQYGARGATTVHAPPARQEQSRDGQKPIPATPNVVAVQIGPYTSTEVVPRSPVTQVSNTARGATTVHAPPAKQEQSRDGQKPIPLTPNVVAVQVGPHMSTRVVPRSPVTQVSNTARGATTVHAPPAKQEQSRDGQKPIPLTPNVVAVQVGPHMSTRVVPRSPVTQVSNTARGATTVHAPPAKQEQSRDGQKPIPLTPNVVAVQVGPHMSTRVVPRSPVTQVSNTARGATTVHAPPAKQEQSRDGQKPIPLTPNVVAVQVGPHMSTRVVPRSPVTQVSNTARGATTVHAPPAKQEQSRDGQKPIPLTPNVVAVQVGPHMSTRVVPRSPVTQVSNTAFGATTVHALPVKREHNRDGQKPIPPTPNVVAVQVGPHMSTEAALTRTMRMMVLSAALRRQPVMKEVCQTPTLLLRPHLLPAGLFHCVHGNVTRRVRYTPTVLRAAIVNTTTIHLM